MPYRTPDRPVEPKNIPQKLNLGFWQESNGYTEGRAVSSADKRITLNLIDLMKQWYKAVKTSYPQDYHLILLELKQVALNRSTLISLIEKPRHLLGVLIAAADLNGDLEPRRSLLKSTALSKEGLVKALKESLVRWIRAESLIRKILGNAFAATSNQLGSYLLDQYSGEIPNQIMQGVYFRAVAQYDLQGFQSASLARDLYKFLYD